MNDDLIELFNTDRKVAKRIINSLPVAIYATDRDGRLRHFNPAAAEFSGREPELGTDKWCVTWKLYYPDGTPMPHEECPMAISLKENRSLDGVEAIAERPDGERIWFRAYPTPLHNEEGEVIGGINMLVDITDQKETEKQIRRNERELNDFFENGTLGLHWVGPEGTVLKANRAELDMLGYSREEYVGSNIADHHVDRDVIEYILERLTAGEELHDYEARLRHKDGSVRHVLINSSAYEENGKFIHTRCFTHDITERKKTEQLQQAQSKLLELIASGKPLKECLNTLCAIVSRLKPGIRVSIMLTDDRRRKFKKPVAPEFSESFGEELEGTPVNDSDAGTCGEAVSHGRPVTSIDIKGDERWSKEWRDLCLNHDLSASHSKPVKDKEGRPAGSFMLCFNESREPNEWEHRLAEFATHITGIAVERDRSDRDLRRSEEKYRSLFDSMDEGFCIVKIIFDEKERPVDFRYREVNAAFEKHTGLEGIEGKLASEVMPDLEEYWFKKYGDICLKGEPETFVEYSEEMGRWFSVSAFPSGDPQEQTVAILFSDITERKENELTNAYLSAIVEGSDDAIISKNLNGVITSWNESAEDMFGYTAEEAVDRNIKMIIPDDRLDEEEEILGRLKRGERIDHFETVREHKDGTLLDISLTISPVRNAGGDIIGASKIARDITERKKYRRDREQLLGEVELERERLSNIFQRAPSFMCILRGPDHVFERANDLYRQLVGDRELIGKPAREAIPEAVGQGFIELLDQVYTSGEAFTGTDMKVLLHHQSDAENRVEEHFLDFVYQPLRDPDGSVSGIFVQGVDLTERKQAKEELQQMNETLEERVEERTEALLSYQNQLRSLASQLSKAEEHERQRLAAELHDNLGQMLAVGKMKVDLLPKEQLPDQLSTEVEELKELMDDALTYTRELMSDLKPPPSLDDEDMKANMRWMAKKMQKHDLEVSIEDDEQPKPLDEEVRTTVLQCIRELLFNVVKHTAVDRARITMERSGGQIEIAVEDKGRGFDTDYLESAPAEEGGFGLFNVRERIDLIGGKVDIVSTPGQGTSITLHIPLKDSEQVIEPSAQRRKSPRLPAEKSMAIDSKIRVLLVDDHQMVREGLRKIIEDEDDMMVIAEAADGEEAVKITRETSPDVILMDVNMPRMGGIEATKKILGESPRIRVIGLSLHDDEGVIRDMRSVGATAYLTKTEAFEALCATIRSEAMTRTE